jgi:hypothetical protein
VLRIRDLSRIPHLNFSIPDQWADLSDGVHEEPAVCDDLELSDAGSFGLVQRLSGRLKGQSSEIQKVP